MSERWADGLRAAELLEEGRALEAERALAPAAREGHGWALLLRARAKMSRGRVRLAVADVTRAFDADPHCAWVAGLGEGAPAHPDARRLAERSGPWGLSREGFPVRAYVGKLKAIAGRGRDALADLDAAVSAAPRQAYVRAWRAETRRRLGDAAGAAEDCEAALRLDPGEAVARVCRARLRLAKGDAAGALQDAARAARLRGYEEAPLEAARACLALGDGRGALRWLDAAFARANRYGWRSLGAGPEALARLAEAPELEAPRWRARLLTWQGEWRLSTGDAAGALEALAEAVRLDRSRAWAWGLRGEAFALLGRRKDARACLDKALRLDRRFARGFLARGRLRLDARDAKGAESDFSAALKADPTWLLAFLWRARARHALKRLDAAAADLAAARRLDPGSRECEALARELGL